METMYFGKYYVEVGKTMIESMLLGSILINIEVAYNITQSEVDKLEQCHESALRKLMSLPSKTPKQMLYFLSGSTPIRFTIQRRRLVYLQHILKQEKESLLRSFFIHQLRTRKTKDWATKIIKDLSEFNITMSMDEIENTAIAAWKEKVKTQTQINALSYLNSNLGSKSQAHTELKMSSFLCPNEYLTLDTAKFIAKVQCHMVENIKSNFKQEYLPNLICNSCGKNECNQPHLLYCEALIGSNQLITYIPNHEDIYNNDNVEEQFFIGNIMMADLQKKKVIEK
jgi:hypothetical protein